MATITIPHPVPPPTEDAERLKKAFQGWGTDEKAVISVLAHRNAAQRNAIRQAYQELYGEDLIKRLEKELAGDFERAVYRWMHDPVEREAIIANVAVKKEIDYRVIVELAAARSSNELLAIRQAYHARYKCSLEEDVAAHSHGDLRKLLVGLVTAYRYEGPEVDANLAKSESKTLRTAIDGKAYNHEEDLKATADDFLSALRAVIRSIYAPHNYYEKVLRLSVNKGTDEDALTRVIVTRAEFDLKNIQEEYFNRSSITLDQVVSKKTSGDYREFLLALLGTGKY
ncbi:Annexin-like protein [Nymphaea thermarum]|nr:Annexin-like protein [Nymphaea thermarum]